jgi:single-stranded DNA-binding protein
MAMVRRSTLLLNPRKRHRRNKMRTAKKSTKNESSQSTQNNQQQKSYSNNLVILTGNLGADAAFFGINDSAASLRMATNTEFGDKKYVEWHSVVAFRELAKEVVEKCTKGRFIKVYGYLHNSKVVKDEVPQFRTEVIATKIKYLDRNN